MTCRVAGSKMKKIDKWLEQYRKIWEARFSRLEDVLAKIKEQKKQREEK